MIAKMAMILSFSQLAVVAIAGLYRTCSYKIIDELCKYKLLSLWHLIQRFLAFSFIETLYFIVL